MDAVKTGKVFLDRNETKQGNAKKLAGAANSDAFGLLQVRLESVSQQETSAGEDLDIFHAFEDGAHNKTSRSSRPRFPRKAIKRGGKKKPQSVDTDARAKRRFSIAVDRSTALVTISRTGRRSRGGAQMRSSILRESVGAAGSAGANYAFRG